jgi:hypothetical protein
MKRRYSLLAAVVLTFVAGATSAFAQDSILRASVPFDFTVSTSTLPAGDYTFSKISTETWSIRNDQTHQAILAAATANGTNTANNFGAVVFKQLGGNYFLSEVRCLGQTAAMPSSKTERTMEREIARNGSKPGSVYVPASGR